MTKISNRVKDKLKRRELRHKQTKAEEILWESLRNNKIGIKFRRQYSLEGYVMDFYSPKAKMAIEIDGGQHYEKDGKEYDKVREEIIISAGVKIMRFTNEEVIGDLERVIGIVKDSCNLTPAPLLSKERGV